MNPVGLIFTAVGVFTLCGAGLDWDWFMNHRSARLFTWLFGRTGARIAYGLLGIGFVVVGLLLAFGVLQDTRQ